MWIKHFWREREIKNLIYAMLVLFLTYLHIYNTTISIRIYQEALAIKWINGTVHPWFWNSHNECIDPTDFTNLT